MINNPFEDLNNRLTNIEQLLNQILALQQEQPMLGDDEIGGIELAEEITGLKKATIYNHVHRGKIPHFKRGGRLYFSKQALLDWITNESRGSPPKEEPEPLPKPIFPRFKNKNNPLKKYLK